MHVVQGQLLIPQSQRKLTPQIPRVHLGLARHCAASEAWDSQAKGLQG